MTAVVAEDRFEHEAMFYRGDADFLAGLLPFVREGLERDEAVVVAEPGPRLDLLRDALGSRVPDVERTGCVCRAPWVTARGRCSWS